MRDGSNARAKLLSPLLRGSEQAHGKTKGLRKDDARCAPSGQSGFVPS